DSLLERPSSPRSEEEKKKKKMGIIRSSFTFLTGTVCGIYIAQNYNVPNIKTLGRCAVSKAKEIEEIYRKPKTRDDA
ncbi:unnamed protein product, partial [Brassica rapa subsp. narinosa]